MLLVDSLFHFQGVNSLHAAFVAYLKYFGSFGVKPDKTWSNITRSSLRTYACWLSVQTETSYKKYPSSINSYTGDATWFKSWHWYYRFVMGARTIPEVQQAMWGMTRKRIADIREKTITYQYGSLNLTNIKREDIFTSERANAYFYRWHILQPSSALSDTKLKEILRAAINANSTLNWSNINAWGDLHEALLIDSLYDKLPSVAVSSKNKVKNWNDSILGSLLSTRNSFNFDSNNLP